ncbi:MAG: hypothetical protein M5U28_25185 [Sandaracinaceae bacterium]|nr:hypothetical protein [Sandaracinaceae bacterium]
MSPGTTKATSSGRGLALRGRLLVVAGQRRGGPAAPPDQDLPLGGGLFAGRLGRLDRLLVEGGGRQDRGVLREGAEGEQRERREQPGEDPRRHGALHVLPQG